METNVKVVGFANKSINGIDIDNSGFDLEYDGRNLNLSGYSNDKLYYAKLNNEQIIDLLKIPSSRLSLDQRIMGYNTMNQVKIPLDSRRHGYSYSKYNKSMKKNIKRIKLTPYKPINSMKIKKKSSTKKVTSYKTPRLRSEYGRSIKSKSKTKHK